MHIVVKAKKVLIEGWVVGEDAYWVIVDFKTIGNRFDNDTGTGLVGKNPMEVSNWKLFAKTGVSEVDSRK